MAKKSAAQNNSKKAKTTKIEQIVNCNPELKTAIDQIENLFGTGSIMALGTEGSPKFDGISTGSLSLDIALGGRGIPKGRIIEIFGPESSGKTTLTLHVVAQAQKGGGIAAFIDAEHALDPSWAKRLGVDLEALLVSQPSSGEEAMRIAEMLVKTNAVDIIVVDSVAALVPEKELQGDIGDSHVGLQARLMSQSMRKLTGAISKSKTAVIFINQIREKVGVMFGNPETTPGGRAEILLLVPYRRPPRGSNQRRRKRDRSAGSRQGRQEQGRPPVQVSGIRYALRDRNQLRRRRSR